MRYSNDVPSLPLPIAVRLGLAEPVADVDPSMFLFERFSMGVMDVLLAWTLPLSAFLMLTGSTYWPLLALVGGGVYLYFPGVFMITRVVLKRNGKKVGGSSSVRSASKFSIVEDGEVLHAGAFGLADRELDRSMTVDTPINVASISKPLAAWGMLALTERSNLNLDTRLSELSIGRQIYTRIFSGSDVSISMLLSHTSGLSGPSVPVTPATEPMPGLTYILLGNSSVPRPNLEGPPGVSYRYSGAGYLILQKIIEDHTQRAFADYMANTVLEPAQMFQSTFSLTPDLLERVAVYYRGDGRRRAPYHLPGAAGGLYSTARDMARFMTL